MLKLVLAIVKDVIAEGEIALNDGLVLSVADGVELTPVVEDIVVIAINGDLRGDLNALEEEAASLHPGVLTTLKDRHDAHADLAGLESK